MHYRVFLRTYRRSAMFREDIRSAEWLRVDALYELVYRAALSGDLSAAKYLLDRDLRARRSGSGTRPTGGVSGPVPRGGGRAGCALPGPRGALAAEHAARIAAIPAAPPDAPHRATDPGLRTTSPHDLSP